jgi:hypothetical protein
METITKATLAGAGVFLALIVGMLLALGAGANCATGETQQLITYQNAPNGEWVTEPVYAECGEVNK